MSMEHAGKRPHTRLRTPVKRLVVDLLSVQYIFTSKCVETTNEQDIHFEPLEKVVTVMMNDTQCAIRMTHDTKRTKKK